MNLLIKQATLLSAKSPHHLKKRDILIKNGCIEKIAANIIAKGNTIDAKGAYVSMGWVDLMADFCDPGFEHKEDIQSGLALAAASGYTDVCLVPNTFPLTTTKSQVAYIKNKAAQHIVALHPIAHVSTCEKEDKLAEMYDMHQAGAVLFGNGKKSVQNAGLLLKALQYIKTINGTFIQIPDTRSISENALMHEGEMSTSLGMAGNPDTAEHIQLQRDIALCEYAESKIHFTGVSSKKSVEIINAAQKKGIQVTCSVTPYHLLYTDQSLANYDSNFKVNPPLRSEKDREYLIKALREGKINAVASHHFPQDIDAKNVEFAYAKNGMISMQTSLSSLIKAGLSAEQISEVLAQQPRNILGLHNTIEEGIEASLTLFNTKEKWTYNKASNRSKSANSPLLGEVLPGKVLGIINKNQHTF